MRKERRKKKSEEVKRKEKKHLRGTNVIFEFGLSFVNTIFMTEN